MRSALRRAFTLIELMVVTAIIGVLVGMLLPAVNFARTAATKAECANNLKQQGIALHSYHDVYAGLPPSKINPGDVWCVDRTYRFQDFYGSTRYDVRNHTGFTLLLPFLDQENLYRRYRFDFAACNQYLGFGPIDGIAGGGVQNCPENMEVIATYVKVFHCPADKEPILDPAGVGPNSLGAPARRSNYLLCVFAMDAEQFAMTPDDDPIFGIMFSGFKPEKYGMFRSNYSTRMIEVLDGLSNTIAIGETKQQNGGGIHPHWGAGHHGAVSGAMTYMYGFGTGWCHLNFPRVGTNGLQHEMTYGSYHHQGANFLFGDGSVHFIRNSISHVTYRNLGTINMGDRVRPEW